jgi:hypothetical protein
VSETLSNSFVIYYIAKHPKGRIHSIQTQGNNIADSYLENDSQQRLRVREFLSSKTNPQIIAEVVEFVDAKKPSNASWPELTKAIALCRNKNAVLVIGEIGNLTNNFAFAEALAESEITFFCCDLTFLDRENFKVIRQHAQVQRQLHGELIKAGLQQTNAKSGNPNAAEVISKVNKPKIDTAIVFACLLHPIIADYRRKGCSQRQMVKMLNDEGFTAPEGGKWVLSQLQKVLDRVRLNELAFEHRDLVTELLAKNYTETQISEEFNNLGISSLKRGAWDETQVKKLINRLEQIQDIESINQFVLNLLPIIHSYRNNGQSAIEIMNKFDQIGLVIRSANREQAIA